MTLNTASHAAVRRSLAPGQLLINGRWRNATDGALMATMDPTTEEKITDVAAATVADVQSAIEAAERSRPGPRLIDGEQVAVVVCGDDAPARQCVMDLVKQIDAIPVDAGPLKVSRYAEPLGFLLMQLAYVQGWGPMRAGVKLLRG